MNVLVLIATGLAAEEEEVEEVEEEVVGVEEEEGVEEGVEGVEVVLLPAFWARLLSRIDFLPFFIFT